VGTVLGFIIYLLFSKWNKKRNRNVPDVDERSVLLMKSYLMGVLYVVLFGSGAVLYMIFFLGALMLVTGLVELQRDRKGFWGYMSIIASLFAFFVVIQGFLLK
jgi:hypothetical protein